MLTRLVALAAFALYVGLRSAAQAQVPLTPERYAAMDRAYSGIVPLSAKSPSRSDYANARTACRSMDSADPLLGPLRRSCNSTVKLIKALEAFDRCSVLVRCVKRSRSTRIAVNRLVRHDREANKAAKAATLVKGCYRELRATKADLRLLERLGGFFRTFQRFAKTGSRTHARRLLRQQKAINRGDTRSPVHERSDFRNACAPAAA